MHDYFIQHGIDFCKSCSDTQQQNSVAERKHRHLVEMTRSFLIQVAMLVVFWLDAVYTAKSLFEVLFDNVPNNSLLKPFGCSCFQILWLLLQTNCPLGLFTMSS